MPPRPSSPATRYRLAMMVPGTNRPSSTDEDEGDDPAPAPTAITAGSALVASSGAAHHGQNCPSVLDSREQTAHRGIGKSYTSRSSPRPPASCAAKAAPPD